MEEYKQYLSELMEYQATGKGKHEWLFYKRKEAVQVANYLRGHGYKVTFSHHPTLKHIGCEFYVGVLKKDLLY